MTGIFSALRLPLLCSTCFGDPNSSASKGLIAGVFFLFGLISMVLLGIAGTAFCWWRRGRGNSLRLK